MGEELALTLFVCVVILYAVSMYGLLAASIRYGRPLAAALCCWFASPVPLAVVAIGMERRDVTHLFDPTVQSWAFMFGDTVFLPFMAAMLALGWRRLGPWPGPGGAYRSVKRRWYLTWYWWGGCLVAGVLASSAFHWVDSVNYTASALYSPAKLMHDFCAYSVLSGGLLFGLVPVLANRRLRRYGMLAMLGFTFWLGAGIADNTFHKLDGRNLHVEYDWWQLRPIPY